VLYFEDVTHFEVYILIFEPFECKNKSDILALILCINVHKDSSLFIMGCSATFKVAINHAWQFQSKKKTNN
jgi:hypothetical protein